jgi:ABC-type tungstate transport system substrate-binding protein
MLANSRAELKIPPALISIFNALLAQSIPTLIHGLLWYWLLRSMTDRDNGFAAGCLTP